MPGQRLSTHSLEMGWAGAGISVLSACVHVHSGKVHSTVYMQAGPRLGTPLHGYCTLFCYQPGSDWPQEAVPAVAESRHVPPAEPSVSAPLLSQPGVVICPVNVTPLTGSVCVLITYPRGRGEEADPSFTALTFCGALRGRVTSPMKGRQQAVTDRRAIAKEGPVTFSCP